MIFIIVLIGKINQNVVCLLVGICCVISGFYRVSIENGVALAQIYLKNLFVENTIVEKNWHAS
jgi:hypothetical protein